MKKKLASCSLVLLSAVQAYAEYDGRDYSLDDSMPSSPSGFGGVVIFIIGVICAFF